MAKRFTDSEKFRDTWYRKLKPKYKCLWEYMLSECSVAGVLELDFDSISFHVGEKITREDLKYFTGRFALIEEDLIFIPKFLQFQQPNGLSRSNKAHNNIFKILEKYNIPETLDIQGFESPLEGASKELPSSPCKGKGISKGISKGNGKKEFGEFKNILLTDEEYSKLLKIYITLDKLEEAFEKLSVWKNNKGKKSTHNYGSLLKSQWVYKEIMTTGSSYRKPNEQTNCGLTPNQIAIMEGVNRNG